MVVTGTETGLHDVGSFEFHLCTKWVQNVKGRPDMNTQITNDFVMRDYLELKLSQWTQLSGKPICLYLGFPFPVLIHFVPPSRRLCSSVWRFCCCFTLFRTCFVEATTKKCHKNLLRSTRGCRQKNGGGSERILQTICIYGGNPSGTTEQSRKEQTNSRAEQTSAEQSREGQSR